MSVALINQHALRMRLIILPSVAHPAVQYFPRLSHNRHDFGGLGGGGILQKMCVLIFSTILARKIYRAQNSAKYFINVHMSSCEVPLVLSDL